MNIRKPIGLLTRVVVISMMFVPVIFLAFFAGNKLEKLGKVAVSFHKAMDKWENFTPENTMELLKKDFKK